MDTTCASSRNVKPGPYSVECNVVQPFILPVVHALRVHPDQNRPECSALAQSETYKMAWILPCRCTPIGNYFCHPARTALFGNFRLNPHIKRTAISILNLGILVAFVFAVQYFWGWSRLLLPWRRLPADTVILAVAGLAFSYGIRALRIYLAEQDIPRGAYLTCLRLILLSNTLNLLLPMRSGEASFPLLMRRWFGIELSRATGILVWLRLLDLHVLAAIAVLCATGGWLTRDSIATDWAPVIAAFCVAAPIILFAFRQPLTSYLQGHEQRAARLAQRIVDGLPSTSGGLLRDLALTWLSWAVKLIGLGWVMSYLGRISPSLGILGAIGGDLSTVLPIHAPGGFGTYEAGVLGLLASVTKPTPGLLAAAVNLHLLVLTTALVGGGIAWAAPRRHHQ